MTAKAQRRRENMAEDPIINKVASSGIITLDLEELYPAGERVVFDLKPLPSYPRGHSC